MDEDMSTDDDPSLRNRFGRRQSNEATLGRSNTSAHSSPPKNETFREVAREPGDPLVSSLPQGVSSLLSRDKEVVVDDDDDAVDDDDDGGGGGDEGGGGVGTENHHSQLDMSSTLLSTSTASSSGPPGQLEDSPRRRDSSRSDTAKGTATAQQQSFPPHRSTSAVGATLSAFPTTTTTAASHGLSTTTTTHGPDDNNADAPTREEDDDLYQDPHDISPALQSHVTSVRHRQESSSRVDLSGLVESESDSGQGGARVLISNSHSKASTGQGRRGSSDLDSSRSSSKYVYTPSAASSTLPSQIPSHSHISSMLGVPVDSVTISVPTSPTQTARTDADHHNHDSRGGGEGTAAGVVTAFTPIGLPLVASVVHHRHGEEERATQEESPLNSLHAFPDDLVLLIFSFLGHDVQSLGRLARVCLKWRSLARAQDLWHPLVAARWGLTKDNMKAITRFRKKCSPAPSWFTIYADWNDTTMINNQSRTVRPVTTATFIDDDSPHVQFEYVLKRGEDVFIMEALPYPSESWLVLGKASSGLGLVSYHNMPQAYIRPPQLSQDVKDRFLERKKVQKIREMAGEVSWDLPMILFGLVTGLTMVLGAALKLGGEIDLEWTYLTIPLDIVSAAVFYYLVFWGATLRYYRAGDRELAVTCILFFALAFVTAPIILAAREDERIRGQWSLSFTPVFILFIPLILGPLGRLYLASEEFMMERISYKEMFYYHLVVPVAVWALPLAFCILASQKLNDDLSVSWWVVFVPLWVWQLWVCRLMVLLSARTTQLHWHTIVLYFLETYGDIPKSNSPHTFPLAWTRGIWAVLITVSLTATEAVAVAMGEGLIPLTSSLVALLVPGGLLVLSVFGWRTCEYLISSTYSTTLD